MTDEYTLSVQVSRYISTQYPDALYHFDYGSGLKMTVGQAKKQKALNPRRGFPDLFIYEPRQGLKGLAIELKREGEDPSRKDGQLKSGKHLAEQQGYLLSLAKRGYAAFFATGYEDTVKLIDEYMGNKGKNEGTIF